MQSACWREVSKVSFDTLFRDERERGSRGKGEGEGGRGEGEPEGVIVLYQLCGLYQLFPLE